MEQSQSDLKWKYLKYYPSELEGYLFETVSEKFDKNHELSEEDFFAIICWKRKPSAVKIAKKWHSLSVKTCTREIYNAASDEEKIVILTNVKEVGLAIASAILTVCYPNKFTILDYRALNSLRAIEGQKCKDKRLPLKVEAFQLLDYLNYVGICREVWGKYSSSLREFDRILWAKDWIEGEKGLSEIIGDYHKTLESLPSRG